jgi:hypothetical protein
MTTDDDVIPVSDEPGVQEEQYAREVTSPVYEGPPVYTMHPLQTDFADEGRNNSIKIILILYSIGLMVMQLKNTTLGFVRPDSDQTESPIVLLLITLALTIWYMFDWKALLPLFFIQCFGIFSIAFFQAEGSLTPLIGAGLVNMMVYYSLFHFDRLNLIPTPINEPQTIPAAST